MMVRNVLLTGVGGQGIITASTVLAQACRLAGWQVKKSEVHGMSQRGGSVNSYVRFSADEQIASPLIPEGEAEMMLAFEPLEGLRQIRQATPDAVVLVEERRIVPVTVNMPGVTYPDDVIERLVASGRRVTVVPASATAVELGESRAANMVMLGALATQIELADEIWSEAAALVLKPRALEVNLRAFEAGRQLVPAGV
ncbi:MAG: indolepyruvate oxidoreductase subunit beta [candidate division WS1 bacterium]|nr:indolepyruvate oxidoreductase subunit beta [candidate division WS1 bacterium]